MATDFRLGRTDDVELAERAAHRTNAMRCWAYWKDDEYAVLNLLELMVRREMFLERDSAAQRNLSAEEIEGCKDGDRREARERRIYRTARAAGTLE